jgi:hypothetical protein
MVPGPQLARVLRWDGDDRQVIGSFQGAIYALGSHDPDGAGPAATELVIGVGGAVLRWNGLSWAYVGTGFGIVLAFAQFDTDGPGPAPARLVAGGNLSFTGGDGYANCDGSTGSPLLTGNDFQCFIDAYASGCP